MSALFYDIILINICETWARCIKLTIAGNFAINGNYHGNRAQQLIKIKVSMLVTIDGKVTINGKTVTHHSLCKTDTNILLI